MQQPDHDLRIAPTAQATPRRLISLALVGIIHVVLIYALVSGLAQNLVKKGIQEIKIATVEEKPEEKLPPPPPPKLELPPPPFIPPPDFVIQTEAPVTNTITTQDVKPVPPAPKPVIASTPVSIGRPHECSNKYPEMSMRMKESGTTTLAFTVGTDGGVTGISVANSSGSPRLDEAAISCASRWRYKAATTGGQAIAVPWKANVVWNLPK
jgi:protein TonB